MKRPGYFLSMIDIHSAQSVERDCGESVNVMRQSPPLTSSAANAERTNEGETSPQGRSDGGVVGLLCGVCHPIHRGQGDGMVVDSETLIDLCVTAHKASEANIATARACAAISKAVHGGMEVPDGLWNTLVEALGINQGLVERVEELLLALIEANKKEEKNATN